MTTDNGHHAAVYIHIQHNNTTEISAHNCTYMCAPIQWAQECFSNGCRVKQYEKNGIPTSDEQAVTLGTSEATGTHMVLTFLTKMGEAIEQCRQITEAILWLFIKQLQVEFSLHQEFNEII